MLESAIQRLDDLREYSSRCIDEKISAEARRVDEQMTLRAEHGTHLRIAETKRIDEILHLRAEYSALLTAAEAKRIDAIRAVDVAAVSTANERATAQAAVLASQVTQSAETLRALVAATATTVAQQLGQVSAQFTERLSSLEKAQYEKQGGTSGMKDMVGWIIGFIMFLIAVGSFIAPRLK